MDPSLTTQVRPPFWWARWVPAALLIVGLMAFTIVVGSTVLVPLVVSVALTFMLEPLVERFTRTVRSRSLAVLLALLTAAALVILVLIVLLPGIWRQLGESIEKLPLALRAASEWLEHLVTVIQQRLSPQLLARVQTALEEFQRDPSVLLSRISQWLAAGLFGLVSIGSGVFGLLIVPFFVYYLLLDTHRLRQLIEARIPARHRRVGSRLLDEIADVMRGYIRGRFLIALIMAILYAAGLLIFRVPLWAAIGLIAGFMGIIPYLGVLAGVVLALGFAALDAASIVRLGGIVGIFIVAQLIEDYVLTPRIVGSKLALHPMVVFIGLIVMGNLFGLLGLILAIPVLGIGKVVLSFLDALYLSSDFYLAPDERVTPSPVVEERNSSRDR